MAEEFAEQPAAASVGEKLRAAREARGLSLAQVAGETRIPQRHLQTIEAGDFTALPARTYAISFSKNYARMVGLDAEQVAQEVRGDLVRIEPDHPRVVLGEADRVSARRQRGEVTCLDRLQMALRDACFRGDLRE